MIPGHDLPGGLREDRAQHKYYYIAGRAPAELAPAEPYRLAQCHHPFGGPGQLCVARVFPAGALEAQRACAARSSPTCRRVAG